VGVIGLGVGEQHARAFAAAPPCRVRALCDFDGARLAAIGRDFPDARRYESADDLIDDPNVAVVSIASYDDHHFAQILRALRAGKHVFAEKPICLTPSELREIREAWRASGRRLSTNTILRSSPRFQWLKAAVADGTLGRLYCIEADYVYGRLSKLTDGWRGRIPGYSAILGGGIHLVDLILWLTGERPIDVVGFGSGLASRHTAFKGNDLVLALLRFPSGLLVKIGANFASVHPHFHRFLAYGTAATFENVQGSPEAAARLWQSRDATVEPQAIEAPYPGIGKGVLIPSFVAAVLGRGEPEVPEPEVFDALSVCLAIDRAVAEERRVPIEYF